MTAAKIRSVDVSARRWTLRAFVTRFTLRPIMAATVLSTCAVVGTANAATTKVTLSASVTVVASCQIAKAAPLDFPNITNAGPAQSSFGEGSVTYACKGVAPKLSASDGTSATNTFSLKHAGGTVPFTLCALEQQYGTACTAIDNDDKSALPIADAGTEYLRGEIVRTAKQQFAPGTYTDDVVVTLAF